MVTFSFIKPPARGSLRRRRMADALRRLTAALCVGLAVLFGLEAVLAVVETEPMVVAARSIRRGDIFWPPTFSWLICRYLRQARLGQAILRMWWAR